MKTILVPTDFSENASNALNYASTLAIQYSARLIVVHIINLPATIVESDTAYSMDTKLEEDYKKELNGIAKNLRQKNNFQVEVKTICQYGYFLATLSDLVKTNCVDLVVMGTKGASNFIDKLMGTNTYDFIKIAPCPVLAIPTNAKFTGIKHIAYGSDFETEETVFLHQLFAFAEPLHSEVSIINILSEKQLNLYSDNQVVSDIAKHFPKKNYNILQIQEPDVIVGLLEFSKENKADIMAISIHDRSIFENIFHNSISKKLLNQAELPLLTLPEKPYQKPWLKTKAQKPQAVPLK